MTILVAGLDEGRRVSFDDSYKPNSSSIFREPFRTRSCRLPVILAISKDDTPDRPLWVVGVIAPALEMFSKMAAVLLFISYFLLVFRPTRIHRPTPTMRAIR